MREKLIDLMTSFYGVDPGYYGVEAYPLAEHLIANDVVPVVRCKDCKHLKYGYQCYCPLGMNLNNDGDAYVLVDPDDDFCSYGERSDGECT